MSVFAYILHFFFANQKIAQQQFRQEGIKKNFSSYFYLEFAFREIDSSIRTLEIDKYIHDRYKTS